MSARFYTRRISRATYIVPTSPPLATSASVRKGAAAFFTIASVALKHRANSADCGSVTGGPRASNRRRVKSSGYAQLGLEASSIRQRPRCDRAPRAIRARVPPA